MPGNTSSVILSSDGSEIYDEQENITNYSLPQKVGLGFSFRNKSWLIGTDLEFKQWSQASIGDNTNLNDTWRSSIGVEYTPDIQGRALWSANELSL